MIRIQFISPCFIFLLAMTVSTFVARGQEGDQELTDEQRLLKKLLRNYNPAVRPVFKASKPVVINLGITLTQVLDVDEKDQVLTTNIWLDQEWRDERMVWNSSEFANINKIRIPCNFLWLPDIVLYNSVDNHNKGYMQALAMVESNGNVFWPPIVKMRSSCKMDITYFPFDDQVCTLKLGSWAYDGFQVDVVNASTNADTDNYVDNGEWTLVGTAVKRNVKYYPCCPEPFPDVTFYIHLRRRVLYYFFNVIIPCMLLSSLSLTGFLLPPDSGEKVTLGLTVLLAFSVFMLLVAENMPPTSEYIPLIGIYLTVIMAMSALSVALSVFVLNLHHKGSLLRRPPRIIRVVARLAGKLMCMEFSYLDRVEVCGPSLQQCDGDAILPENARLEFACSHDTCFDFQINGLVDNSGPRPRNMGQPCGERERTQAVSSSNSVEREILKYLKFILEAYDKGKVERVAVCEWQEIARVMDKFFFLVFFAITAISTIVLLVISPLGKDTRLIID